MHSRCYLRLIITTMMAEWQWWIPHYGALTDAVYQFIKLPAFPLVSFISTNSESIPTAAIIRCLFGKFTKFQLFTFLTASFSKYM